MSLFFVVSTGRSGSQTIAELLDRSPDAVCLHEPEPRLLFEITAYLYGELPHAELVDLLRETRPTVQTGGHYGESHHRLSWVIPVLHEAFPAAKFIWLLRDGRATVASLYARRTYTGRRFSPDRLGQRWETTRVRGDRLGQMRAAAWRSLTRFEKCCWHWTQKNRWIERDLAACGCEWMQVRLEDLAARSEAVFDFLGLRLPDDPALRRLNVARPEYGRQLPTGWQSWRDWQIVGFARLCSAAMDDWYPDWRREVADSWRVGVSAHANLWARHRLRAVLNEDVIDAVAACRQAGHAQLERWARIAARPVIARWRAWKNHHAG